jgi:hypothetical protein
MCRAIKFKWQVITVLSVAHFFHWSIVNLQKNLLSQWQIIQCLHAFTNCYLHFHSLIIVELATSWKLLLISKVSTPSHAAFTSIFCLHHYGYRSAIIRHSALMTCCTPIMPSPYTSVRWMRYFMGGKHFSPINTELPFMGPSFQCWCHCTSTYPINSIWQTDSCAICCMLPVLQLLHTSSVVLQPNSGLHSLNCACLRILNERFVLWCWHDNPHTSTPILSDVRVPVSSSAALA